MSKNADARLAVRKMYKLYINGAFVRSESGLMRASRKDARDSVVAARAAQPKWWNAAPGTRGLILYRLAEMMESRRDELAARLREGMGCSDSDAQDEVSAAIDRTVWYAGWCDKFNALLSTRNPVGGPHFNVSTAEPTGVVAILAPDRPSLLGLVSVLLPALAAGNAVVLLASERDPRTAIAFAECLATSDLPAGVANILTGFRTEIAPVLATHMDVNAIVYEEGDSNLVRDIERHSAENVKRCRAYPDRSRSEWFASSAQSLDDLAALCEIKTIWHPAGV